MESGDRFFGQDANYNGNAFSYTDNIDGTVTDHNTGLIWEQAHHETKLEYYEAETYCEDLELGGLTEWRLPTIKELFSLANFKVNDRSLHV